MQPDLVEVKDSKGKSTGETKESSTLECVPIRLYNKRNSIAERHTSNRALVEDGGMRPWMSQGDFMLFTGDFVHGGPGNKDGGARAMYFLGMNPVPVEDKLRGDPDVIFNKQLHVGEYAAYAHNTVSTETDKSKHKDGDEEQEEDEEQVFGGEESIQMMAQHLVANNTPKDSVPTYCTQFLPEDMAKRTKYQKKMTSAMNKYRKQYREKLRGRGSGGQYFTSVNEGTSF